MRYYPIYLDLQDKPVLVVGGGAVAEGKALQLVEAGARVLLVSPDLTAPLREAVAHDQLVWRQGEFADADLDGQTLVIGATDDQAVNERIAQLAQARGLLHNIVDQPALCSFITPALVTRGGLQISISTAGGSPAVAQRVKREIADLIGDEYAVLLELAAAMRRGAKQRLKTFEERRDALQAFVASNALELIRAGKRDEAAHVAETVLTEFEKRAG